VVLTRQIVVLTLQLLSHCSRNRAIRALVLVQQSGKPWRMSVRAVEAHIASHLANFGAGTNNLIFADDQGCPLQRNRLSAKFWRPAVAASHYPAEAAFHLRHYYASLLINAGESVKRSLRGSATRR
jgi:site-specific recombinase XerD